MDIYYGATKVNGQFLTPQQTSIKPQVMIPDGYVLIMWDKTKNFLHWIATSQGDVVEYHGPSPPQDGLHHVYVFDLIPLQYAISYNPNRQNFMLSPDFEVAGFNSSYTSDQQFMF